MSYVALARKWRPKRFSEVVGQEHVRQALTNALASGRVHHAFLFCGMRGVGKTTIARILAKCLNCERGVSAEPCGQCQSCREIDEGRFIDLLEVDAASRTKVDDTRELLDNVQYAPTRGRFKVYLIDEVHMLSVSSFNALLKTLEEPPPHVKFLLATTDPQKLPATVLSRCLQFNLKRLSATHIAEHLEMILAAEGIEYEPGGVQLVAQSADGSVRDSLSLLDQLIAFGGGRVAEAAARAMLGTVARDHVVGLAERLAASDPVELMRYAATLDQWAPDYAQLLGELAALLTRIAVKHVASDLETEGEYSAPALAGLAEALTPEDVQLYYQAAILGRRDLPLAPDPRSGFEMTLLRMVTFRLGADAEPLRSADTSTAAAKRTAERTGEPDSVGQRPAERQRTVEARVESRTEGEDWAAIVPKLEIQGAARQLASHCVLLDREGGTVRLGIEARSAFVRTRAQEDKLAQALARYYGEPIRLEIIDADGSAETPARASERAARAELEAARLALDTDPTVRALRERFGATIQPDTVRPAN